MRSQPTAGITLREATATDVAGVVRLIAAHAAQAGERTPITEEYVRRYLTSPGSRILLAEQGGGLIGLLSYSRRPDLYHAAEVGTVEELVVEAAYRGQGIGTALLAELESRALAEG